MTSTHNKILFTQDQQELVRKKRIIVIIRIRIGYIIK